MVTRERRVDRGKGQARRRLVWIGDELREARLSAGLSQRQLGVSAGISHAEIGRIEHAASPRVPYETLAIVGALLGLDVSLRSYPDGEPVRDAAQLALLSRLRLLLPADLVWGTEVPIRVPGDRRAWDAVIAGRGWRVPVDAESRLRDVQACTRKVALKRRDDGSDVVILLVADTRHNRHVLRLARADLAAEFSVSGKAALASLAKGEPPTGSAVLLL